VSHPSDRYPPQVRYIVGSEGAERFSFYGMRSILTIYMARYLLLPEHEAEANFHLFVMACYLTPLVGGWLADRLLGRYRVILWLSFGYVLGHLVMAGFESKAGLFAGLALIAAGSGGIKPCVSAFVGDQFRPEQKTLLSRVYGLFYWMVNLGSVTSTLLIPVLLARFGPRVAFSVPAVLMAVALAIFVAGRSHYVGVPPTGPNPHSFTHVVASALTGRNSVHPLRSPAQLGGSPSVHPERSPAQPGGVEGPPLVHWLDRARSAHPADAVDGAKAVFRIMGVFAAVTAFWALFDQHSSSWVLQAGRMDLDVGGHRLQASQLAALNPVMVLVLIPLFARVVFPALEGGGVRVTPLGKMTVGMFLTVLSFVAAAFVEASLAGGSRPSALWQIPQYALLTSSEVLVSVTGLEFSYTQAPRAMKSTIMSIWYLTVALGNFLTATISTLNRFHGPAYFWFFAALMLAGAVGFTFVARRYKPVEAAPVNVAEGAA
jgi:POT family proton-dependent oligopeptide transporter